MTVTRRLCEKIVATTADSVGEAAIAKAHQLVLDGIAVAVAGARIEEAPKILANYLRGQGSMPECSALGFGFRLAAVPAALLNATSMHVLDFEPMWTPATHALSPALAPVLALAELIGADGREVLTAVIKGIEIQGWIRGCLRPRGVARFQVSSARHGGADRRGRRGFPSAKARCHDARQCDRHRDLALRQPHQQHRHHDQGHPLRLCGLARSRIRAAGGERLHRGPRSFRQRERLCRHIPAAPFRPRDAVVLRPAISSGRSGLCAKSFSMQVHDPLRHHRRAGGAAAHSIGRCDPCGPDGWRPSFAPATARIPSPDWKANSACNIPSRRHCSTAR